MKSILDNYINGNLTDAKNKAKKYSFAKLLDFLLDFYPERQAIAITQYLKNQIDFKEVCQIEHSYDSI